MHMEINDYTTLRQIRKKFSEYYPYLQIEFYNTPHRKQEVSERDDMIDHYKTVGMIRKTHLSAILEIQPLYKVSAVEREFRERFGLSVQVLSKEKNNWAQAAGLDDLTLKELNELSRNASDEYILSEPDSE
ncbi:MAG: hypothetical protein Q8L07_06605 [Sediminibacterium sp.]|nr:hypothetical protein [Sediminibacterium sp.]MDP1811282.1 hypothetical protein [Sediminibacterium sp.]